jgi:hypothetical protein
VVAQRRQARRCSGGEGGRGGRRVAPPGGCSFYSQCKRLAKAVRAAVRVVAVVKLGARQRSGGHGLNAVSTGGRRCSDRATDEWALAVLDFSNLFKTGSTLKIKMDTLTYSKNSQFFHVASLGYIEQFSILCQD